MSRTLMLSLILCGFTFRGIFDQFLSPHGRVALAWFSVCVSVGATAVAYAGVRKAKRALAESRAKLESLLQGRPIP